MTYFYIFLLLIASYLIGSIQSGLIIGKVFKNIDIREHGSKNTGSTNAIRVLGFKYGIWAFVFDTLKGALIITLLRYFADPSLYMIHGTISFLAVYGFTAVIGHVYSVFNHFKGGKAVATSLGAIFAISPIIAGLILVVFAITFFTTRYVSLGSTFSAIFAMIAFTVRIFISPWGFNIQSRIFDLVVFLFLAAIIFLRHKPNYQRLKSGEEHKM